MTPQAILEEAGKLFGFQCGLGSRSAAFHRMTSQHSQPKQPQSRSADQQGHWESTPPWAKQTTAAENAPVGNSQMPQQAHWRLSPRSRAEAAAATASASSQQPQPTNIMQQTPKVQAAAKAKKVPPWAKDPQAWQAQQQEKQRQKLAKAQGAEAANPHQPAEEDIPPLPTSNPHPTPVTQGQKTGAEEEAQAQIPAQQNQAQQAGRGSAQGTEEGPSQGTSSSSGNMVTWLLKRQEFLQHSKRQQQPKANTSRKRKRPYPESAKRAKHRGATWEVQQQQQHQQSRAKSSYSKKEPARDRTPTCPKQARQRNNRQK